MNKEIEEMMLTVPQKIVAYDGNPAGQHLYGEQRQEIAEALYNAGYRKVSGSEAELQELNIKYYNEAKDLRRSYQKRSRKQAVDRRVKTSSIKHRYGQRNEHYVQH